MPKVSYLKITNIGPRGVVVLCYCITQFRWINHFFVHRNTSYNCLEVIIVYPNRSLSWCHQNIIVEEFQIILNWWIYPGGPYFIFFWEKLGWHFNEWKIAPKSFNGQKIKWNIMWLLKDSTMTFKLQLNYFFEVWCKRCFDLKNEVRAAFLKWDTFRRWCVHL